MPSEMGYSFSTPNSNRSGDVETTQLLPISTQTYTITFSMVMLLNTMISRDIRVNTVKIKPPTVTLMEEIMSYRKSYLLPTRRG